MPSLNSPFVDHDSLAGAVDETPVHRHRARASVRLTLNLTVMIDMVFLLLVYFMTVTEFKQGEEVYRMDLPNRSDAAWEPDPFDLDEEPLRISVATTGAGVDSYLVRIEGPYTQPNTFDELYDFLRARQINEENLTGPRLFAPDHPIIIAPADSANWDHAVGAYNAAARAEYENVTFAPPE